MVRNPDGSLMILDTLANFEDEDVCNEYRIVEANNPDCIFTPPDPEWDDFEGEELEFLRKYTRAI